MDPVTAAAAVRVARAVPWRRVIAAAAVAATLALLGALAALQALLGAATEPADDGPDGSCVTLADAPAAPGGPAADGPGTGGDGLGYGNARLTHTATVADLDDVNIATAAAIVTVGADLGVPARGQIIAIATALQESRLDWRLSEAESDRDSAGAFQQRRPWGPDRVTAQGSARLFYTGGAAGQSGLLDINGWERMPLTVAAQRVQVSAFPDAYGRWERLATDVVVALGGGTPSDGLPPNYAQASAACTADAPPGGFETLAGTTDGERAVNAAARWLGTPYAWGGGTPDGPSQSIRPGETQVGFDCSGLILHAWWQAAQVPLPHSAAAIAAGTVEVPREQARAGDILSFSDGSRVYHDGLYDGRGNLVHAPRTGKTVEVVEDIWDHPYYAPRLVKISRPVAPGGSA